MKKLLALLLSLILLFSFSGCSDLAQLGLDIATDVILEETESYEESGNEGYAEPETEAYVHEDPTSSADDAPPEEPEATVSLLDKDGWYYSADEVSEYIYTYGHLPDNFITKKEARELGWEGGSVERYADGCAIGGDVFGNREGLLPDAPGRTYYECDIDTNGASSRGAKRIVFSNDGLIYYTDDHYESFTLLYGEE